MNVLRTAIPDVLIFEPAVHADARGFFMETFRDEDFRRAAGCARPFVQDNHSRSARNVLRGLHYQIRRPQGKLVRVVAGEVFDVAVDLRRGSATFGKWVGERLSAENKRQMWIPEGIAHGFLVLSDFAETLYKATDYYAPAYERTLLWNDAAIGIAWPLAGAPILTPKDTAGAPLAACEVFS
ncbi:MAG: dTDP-4-dehydrorhamnose 3,5-epimerase [Vicinamibacterales bacterium]|jgi:dTDP-4-dehydrorhamnose 3,5-epimerase|nr:dTDP-4-dehydrorhamnose 3,5-epimerase [Vicinamibacterales bacterium]